MAIARCYRFFGRGILDFAELMKADRAIE